MKYYQELTILPGPELSPYAIWSEVYRQLHLGFASKLDENGRMAIGVSFPGYTQGDKPSLGNKLRLFATEEKALHDLAAKKLLGRLADYVHLTSIRPVPEKAVSGYAAYSRVHQVRSVTQKARRYAKKHDVAYEEATSLFPAKPMLSDFPYIQLKSLTNRHSFSLLIGREEKEAPFYAGFSSYGLSNSSTVPEFR